MNKSLSNRFLELTGITVTAFAKRHSLRQGQVWQHLRKGYCAWPLVPRDNRTKHPLHSHYVAMLRRVYDKGQIYYKNYGARGIKVSGEWYKDFWTFVKDMGPKPGPDYSIDRIDNDGNYCKENCRWATRTEQGNNRSKNAIYNGKTIAEISKETGINYSTLRGRHQRRNDIDWDREKDWKNRNAE